MYVYEEHLYGGLYATDYEKSIEECYCEQCGECDWLIGEFNNPKDFLEKYANFIDCYDNNGGVLIDHVFENVLAYFDEEISMDEAIKIVQSSRTWDFENDE